MPRTRTLPAMIALCSLVAAALPGVAAQDDCVPIETFANATVGEFPKGADERESATNDSAVAVYVLVPHSKVRGPKAVKYIWSENVPAGTRLDSNAGLTQVRVLRSGADRSGAWVDERVNVRDDYLKYFDTKDTPKPAGIGVLTDADDTKSTAAGDYADFRACRR